MHPFTQLNQAHSAKSHQHTKQQSSRLIQQNSAYNIDLSCHTPKFPTLECGLENTKTKQNILLFYKIFQL